jgi:hypothetical protein
MLTLKVDFNTTSDDGLVRGLQEDVSGNDDLLEGALVLLDDGEGNEALGTLRQVRDGLVFAEVDWDTWSPAGAFVFWASLPLPEQAKEVTVTFKVTGDVWPLSIGNGLGGRFGFVERLLPNPATA